MIFRETQRMISHWWIFILLGLSSLVAGSQFVQQYQAGELSVEMLVVLVVVFTLAIALIILIKLEIEIKNKALHYRFVPFIWSWRKIRAEEITSYEFKKVSPLTDFGGYGYRWTPKRGPGYIIDGDYALYLTYGKKPKRLTLTIDQYERCKAALDHIMISKKDHG